MSHLFKKLPGGVLGGSGGQQYSCFTTNVVIHGVCCRLLSYFMYSTVYIQIFAGRYFHEFRESVEVREIIIVKILTISQGNIHVQKVINVVNKVVSARQFQTSLWQIGGVLSHSINLACYQVTSPNKLEAKAGYGGGTCPTVGLSFWTATA